MAVSSPARIAASRNNGRLSRGPATADGKQRASRNAVTHGLAGRGVAALPEDQRAADRKAEAWAEALGVANEVEADLVAEGAAALVRARRIAHTQAARAERRAQGVRARRLVAASRGWVAASEAADAWPELIAAVESSGKFTLNQLKAARLISGAVEADPRVQQLRDLDARIQRRDPQALPDLLVWMRRQAEDAAVEAEERRLALAAAEADPRPDAWVDRSATGERLSRYRGEAIREVHRSLALLDRLRRLPAVPAPVPIEPTDDDPRNEPRSGDETRTCAPIPAETAAEPPAREAEADGVGPAATAPAEGGADARAEAVAPSRNEPRSGDGAETYVRIPTAMTVVTAVPEVAIDPPSSFAMAEDRGDGRSGGPGDGP